MAMLFDGSTDYFTTSSSPRTSLPLTFTAWCKPDTDSSSRNIMSINDIAPSGNSVRSSVVTLVTDRKLQSRAGAGIFTNNTLTNDGNWHHVVSVFASGTNNTIAKIDANTFDSGIGTGSTITGLDTFSIGAVKQATGPIWHWSGSIAEVAVYNISLSNDDMTALFEGASPLFVRPNKLVFYAPLIHNSNDYFGTAMSAPDGTPTVVDHPRIFRPASQSFFGF